MADVRVFDDPPALAASAAGHIAGVLREAIALRGEALLALTGGRTIAQTYRILATEGEDDLDWSRVFFFFSDERCVPAEHPESNYGMVREALLTPLRIGEDQVFRMDGEQEPEQAAHVYETGLRDHLGDDLPLFDLVLLGLGEDGHVASLFPGTPALHEEDRWVVPAQAPSSSPVRDRLTLTLPVLNSAREVLFVVSGAGKREAVRRALEGDTALPASHIRPSGQVTWFLDAEAAAA